MKLRTVLLAATVLALPVAVQAAEPVSGVYVSLGAGLNLMPDTNVAHSSGTSTNVGFRDGFAGVGAIGYGLGNGLRVELEGDYRSNAPNKLNNGLHIHGEEQKSAVMINALYDFNNVDLGGIIPYVGAGVGYGWAYWKGVNIYDNSGVSQYKTDATEGSVALQGIIGAAYDIPGVPGLAATAEYRFFAMPESRTYTGTTGNAKINDDYNHSFLLGLRYAFNTAPPPPVAAPAPMAPPPAAITRNYLVFFDWDRADLSARARQIIAEAADNSKKVQVTRIQVNGYTDLSGSAAYNMKLSVRRAQAVAAELVRDGVARSEIDIKGFGETNPLVPTADGVREPQNRRVEIILQ